MVLVLIPANRLSCLEITNIQHLQFILKIIHHYSLPPQINTGLPKTSHILEHYQKYSYILGTNVINKNTLHQFMKTKRPLSHMQKPILGMRFLNDLLVAENLTVSAFNQVRARE
jgi:hypothetical protein